MHYLFSPKLPVFSAGTPRMPKILPLISCWTISSQKMFASFDIEKTSVYFMYVGRTHSELSYSGLSEA